MSTHGRRHETEPLEHHGEPLRRLEQPEDLIPFDLGVAEPPGGFRNVFPRNSQILIYDATPPGQPEEPPWVPLRDIISRAPMCRCVLPVEDDD